LAPFISSLKGGDLPADLLNQTSVLKNQLSVIEKRLLELEAGKKETV